MVKKIKQATVSRKSKRKPVVLDLTPQDQKLVTKTPGMIVPNKDRLGVELEWMWKSGWWNRTPKGLILGILIFGLLYHILLTWGGNFIFHIDSARDMIDVREMVVLHHLRLIGPTSGIDGLFTGPGWYYLLAIPFILTGGNPYAEVLLMDLFWLIGGYFLLKMLKPQGSLAVIAGGSLWIASNYIVLVTLFAYNPNPATLLSPLIVYVIARYLDLGTMKSALALGFLGVFLWNLEMAFAGFVPFMIVLAMVIGQKWRYFIQKPFWIGIVLPFLAGLIPQVLFELRHNFFMIRSVYTYLTQQRSLHSTFSLHDRSLKSWNTFLEGFRGIFFNQTFMIWLAILLIGFLFIFIVIRKKGRIESQILAAILLCVVPFIGFSLLPLVIQIWHVEVCVAALIFLVAISIGEMKNLVPVGKWLALIATIIILVFSFNNLELSKNINIDRPVDDPSEFKNEISAIDYAYKQADGKNFKAYVYSPGILDLPYQYNFWWYGQNNKYGYLPKEYAYLPNQPPYINNKERLSNGKNPPDSGLVILIKEPGYAAREDLWKNSFTTLPLLKSDTTGPLRLEVRKEN